MKSNIMRKKVGYASAIIALLCGISLAALRDWAAAGTVAAVAIALLLATGSANRFRKGRQER
jgi:hypothetical protein